MVVNTNTLGGEASGKSHARSESSGQILALPVRGLALRESLVLADILLRRVSVFVRTLHPEIVGRPFICQPDASVTITESFLNCWKLIVSKTAIPRRH